MFTKYYFVNRKKLEISLQNDRISDSYNGTISFADTIAVKAFSDELNPRAEIFRWQTQVHASSRMLSSIFLFQLSFRSIPI